jgi:hypothetical protein
MGIEDIQISEELETNAPSIKYSGNEGPKSPEEEQMMMADAILEEEYNKYVFDLLEIRPEATPMTLEEFRQMVIAEGQMSKGPILPSPEDPVNPFGPKPIGPPLPNRQMAAYGGIMGLDGRKQYGIGSWFQENVMDPLKVKVLGLPDEYDEDGNLKKAKDYDAIKAASQARVDSQPEGYEGFFDTLFKGEKNEKGVREGGITSTVAKNIIPIIGGAAAGLFTKNTESDTPGLPSDTTALALDDLKKSANILDQKQGMAAGLNFLPTVASRKYSPSEMLEVYQNAANGGRIGFAGGGGFGPEGWSGIERAKRVWNSMSDDIQNKYNGFNDFFMGGEWIDINMANGGRIGRAEGGLMDLGGMEKDYRAEGGFVPIGKQEKADDVPARLSVNEFVFTADAVRNAGGGDIDQGAQVMENMMKHLEAGGQVSEESQGMAGARDMFATSQRLGDVV